MFKVDFLPIGRALDFFNGLDFRISGRSLVRAIINYFKILNIIIKRE